MQKDILRRLNFLIYLLIFVGAMTLQSTIFKYFPLNYLQPDFALIIAVYMGFKRDNVEGGIFVMLMAILLEAHSSTGEFFYLAIYTYSFVIVKLISVVVVIPNRLTIVMISSVLSVVTKLMMLFLLSFLGRASNGLMHFFIYLVPSTISQAFCTLICIQWFNSIDLKTFKDSHSEDEYDINREF